MADIRRSVSIDFKYFKALETYARIANTSVEECLQEAVHEWLTTVAVSRVEQILKTEETVEEVADMLPVMPFINTPAPRKTILLTPRQARLVLG